MLTPYSDVEDEYEKVILCVGMCVLDCIHSCAQYPVEDSDKRCTEGRLQRGGNASNVCTVLSHLGAKCEFLGMLSSSHGFEFLQTDFREKKIKIRYCPMVNKTPPFSTVILSNETGSRTIIHSNPSFPILTYDHFSCVPLFTNNMAPGGRKKPLYHWIHFEGRNTDETIKMMNDIRQLNADLPEQEKIKISVELEKQDVDLLPLAEMADYVFISKDFAEYLGFKNPKDAVYGIYEMLRNMKEAPTENDLTSIPIYKKKEMSNIICPWGADGTSCLDIGKDYSHIPSFPPSTIIDSLGAGDTFCAAAVYALSISKANLISAVEFGNRVAGFKLKCEGFEKLKLFRQK